METAKATTGEKKMGDMIPLMSNQALREMAKFGVDMADIKPRYRFDAIDARRELNRRDMVEALATA